MIEAVIFDLDGVLVDSEHVWDEVREELARERGGRWHERAQADMMGMSSVEWSRYMHDVIGLAESPEEIETFKENVREIAAEARAAGIRLCIETDSNLLPTAEIGRKILDEIGDDWVQINYDPGNVVYYTGADPGTDIEYALPRLGHFHLKDQRGGKGKADFPPLGDGDVDLPHLLRRLAESGFSGPVSMEIEFTDYQWPPWEECVEAAIRAKAYWDGLGI